MGAGQNHSGMDQQERLLASGAGTSLPALPSPKSMEKNSDAVHHWLELDQPPA